jgi:hypothetical protein
VGNRTTTTTTTTTTTASAASGQNDKYAVAVRDSTATMTTSNGLDITNDIVALRRLFVVHRIPTLQSLDGVPVTAQELNLARPRCRPELQVQQRSEAEGWVEQAEAKVTANVVKKGNVAATVVCLLDDDEEDEEDEENDDPALLSTPRRPRRAVSESAVEIDVNGLPMTSPERPVTPRHRRSLTCDDCVIRSPPRFTDDDDPLCHNHHWEYASVESSAACEWTAACGALSLSYFRKPTLPLTTDRARTKSTFQRKAKRKKNDKNRHVAKSAAAVAIPDEHLTEYTFDLPSALSSRCYMDPLIQIDGHREKIRSASPQKRLDIPPTLFVPQKHTAPTPRISAVEDRIEATLPPAVPAPAPPPAPKCDSPTHSSTSTQNAVAAANRPRVPAALSLTSPFPMQFRIRARATTTTISTVVAVASHATPAQTAAAADDDDDDDYDDETQELRIMTDFPSSGDYHQSLPTPREAVMDTIEIPITLARSRSSPSKLPSLRGRLTPPPILTKGELPPPCPGRRRKMVPHAASAVATTTSTTRTIPHCNSTTKVSSRKSTCGANQWHEKLSARSMSIMDDDDDDDYGFLSSDDDSL